MEIENTIQKMKHEQGLESVSSLFTIERKPVKSRLLKDQETNDTVICLPFLETSKLQLSKEMKVRKITSMQESLLRSRRTTWSVKSSHCNPNIPDTKLYETQVRGLIGKDQDCTPFFEDAWKERYARLSLPTRTYCLDSDSILSNLSLRRQEESSWWKTERKALLPLKSSVKTFFPSYTSSRVDNMEDEATENENLEPPKKKRKKVKDRLQKNNEVMRCRRVRVRPPKDPELRERLFKMLGVYRYIYNECVDLDKKGEIEGATNKEMRRIRTLLTKKDNYREKTPWKDDLPSLAKQSAVESYFAAKKESLKRCAMKKIKKFQMKKKSRFFDPQQTIPFERYKIHNSGRTISTCIDRKPLSFRVIGKIPKELRRNDLNFLRKEIKMTKTRLGKWYLCIPICIGIKEHNKPFEGEICALDPGVRTFQTCYGTDGVISQIGTSFKPLENILKRADKIQCKLAKNKNKKFLNSNKKRINKRLFLKLLKKVHNRVNDLHNKVVSWLCKNYRIILIPEFETQTIAENNSLSSKTCRAMLSWAHYRFRKKLIEHAQRYTYCKVRVVNEAYTSKTCGNCGILHEDLGSKKTFKCPSCKICMDRDENAARNILLRNLEYIFD